MNNVPDVNSYLQTAKDLAEYLKGMYEIIGQPNIFWHPIKEVDPEIYGKAQTLMKIVLNLFDIAREICTKRCENSGPGTPNSTETSLDVDDPNSP